MRSCQIDSALFAHRTRLVQHMFRMVAARSVYQAFLQYLIQCHIELREVRRTASMLGRASAVGRMRKNMEVDSVGAN
jgi:hypothetical protein